jgi:hypothetical protein
VRVEKIFIERRRFFSLKKLSCDTADNRAHRVMIRIQAMPIAAPQ